MPMGSIYRNSTSKEVLGVRAHHCDPRHHGVSGLKRYISRTMAAALDGLSGSAWLSSFSERRAMISFSASRIAASISAGHLPIRLVELRCGCFGPLLRFHVHHHHALRRAVQVNLPSGK